MLLDLSESLVSQKDTSLAAARHRPILPGSSSPTLSLSQVAFFVFAPASGPLRVQQKRIAHPCSCFLSLVLYTSVSPLFHHAFLLFYISPAVALVFPWKQGLFSSRKRWRQHHYQQQGHSYCSCGFHGKGLVWYVLCVIR